MDTIQTCKLNQKQKDDLNSLTNTCYQEEPVLLTFPVEEGGFFLLQYDNQLLVCALSLFFPEIEICECMIFTHPNYRRRGLATTVLNKACTYLEERETAQQCEIDLVFITDGNSPSAQSALQVWETVRYMQEHLMEFNLPAPSFQITDRKQSSILLQALSYAQSHMPLADLDTAASYLTISAEQLLLKASDSFEFIELQLSDRSIGSCSFLFQNETIFLYQFEILESYRNKGYGSTFLQAILSFLSNAGFKKVKLQVSGYNTAALALYKKTGFRISETLSYYLY